MSLEVVRDAGVREAILSGLRDDVVDTILLGAEHRHHLLDGVVLSLQALSKAYHLATQDIASDDVYQLTEGKVAYLLYCQVFGQPELRLDVFPHLRKPVLELLSQALVDDALPSVTYEDDESLLRCLRIRAVATSDSKVQVCALGQLHTSVAKHTSLGCSAHHTEPHVAVLVDGDVEGLGALPKRVGVDEDFVYTYSQAVEVWHLTYACLERPPSIDDFWSSHHLAPRIVRHKQARVGEG